MRNDRSPLVSVIVPTYYRNDLLSETIRSVRDQTYDRIETIVVDDSGDGHAEQVVTGYEDIDYVALEANRGANGARTVGARRSDGDYVHFLDDDDRMHEEKIEKQVQRADAAQEAGVIYTGLEKSGGHTDLPAPHIRGDVLERALSFDMWPCLTSTMLIERDLIDELLPLSDRQAATDFELIIRLARRTKFDYVDEPLLYKRIDINSLGSSLTAVECRKGIIEEYEAVYDEYPDRVRRQALAETFETEGVLLLRKHGWSLRAIRSLVKHAYYTPNERLKSVAKLTAACFGRPGWEIASRVNRSI